MVTQSEVKLILQEDGRSLDGIRVLDCKRIKIVKALLLIDLADHARLRYSWFGKGQRLAGLVLYRQRSSNLDLTASRFVLLLRTCTLHGCLLGLQRGVG